MAKFYDTCALLNFPPNLFEDFFYLSSITLNELEGIKTSAYKDEEIKYAAKKLLRLLDKNPDKYEVIPYKATHVFTRWRLNLPNTNDSKILVCAYKSKADEFVTNDMSCKALARRLGMNVSSVENKEEGSYTGYLTVRMNDQDMTDFYSSTLPANDNHFKLLTNQYLIIQDSVGQIVDKYKWTGSEYVKIPFIKVESKMFGKVVPKNGDLYQLLALDSLANNQITMLRGHAGTGKSYLAFGHMFSLLETGKVDKIIVFCNTVATKGSAKLGFYPGTRTEKLLDSQIGNLLCSKLGDRSMVEKLIEDGHLVLLPMSDIRGYDTTGMNAAVYISEAQNLDIELMKLALQRIGEDSILILDGDSDAQVDLSMYAGANNGMRRVSKVFRGTDVYGEVTLVNIHRSKIAAIADKM
jgi:predicted ribonuclease YlaK